MNSIAAFTVLLLFVGSCYNTHAAEKVTFDIHELNNEIRDEVENAVYAITISKSVTDKALRTLGDIASQYAMDLFKHVYYTQRMLMLHHQYYNVEILSQIKPILERLADMSHNLQRAVTEEKLIKTTFKNAVYISGSEMEKLAVMITNIQKTNPEKSLVSQEVLKMLSDLTSNLVNIPTRLNSETMAPSDIFNNVRETTTDVIALLKDAKEDRLEEFSKYCMLVSFRVNELLVWFGYWLNVDRHEGNEKVLTHMQKFAVDLSDVNSRFQHASLVLSYPGTEQLNAKEDLLKDLQDGLAQMESLLTLAKMAVDDEMSIFFIKETLTNFLIAMQDVKREVVNGSKRS